MKTEFDIDVQWFGKTASDKVIAAAMKGLKQGGEVAGGEAMKLTPVLSGTLKRSICVTEGGTPNLDEVFEDAKTSADKKQPNVIETKQGDELSVYVSANTPYAYKQHEQNKNNSKFLERGLQNAQEVIPKLVERQLKRL